MFSRLTFSALLPMMPCLCQDYGTSPAVPALHIVSRLTCLALLPVPMILSLCIICVTGPDVVTLHKQQRNIDQHSGRDLFMTLLTT